MAGGTVNIWTNIVINMTINIVINIPIDIPVNIRTRILINILVRIWIKCPGEITGENRMQRPREGIEDRSVMTGVRIRGMNGNCAAAEMSEDLEWVSPVRILAV